ncbi:MAG: hypothetical protein ACLVJH_14865 [Faecalibacterium prausnitzii]
MSPVLWRECTARCSPSPGSCFGAYTEAALPAGALANATHLV